MAPGYEPVTYESPRFSAGWGWSNVEYASDQPRRVADAVGPDFGGCGAASPRSAADCYGGRLARIESGRGRNLSARGAGALQPDSLAERCFAELAGLERQCELEWSGADRRIDQLERRLKDVGLREGDQLDMREKWAEMQGSLNGLMEESQALTRRMEALDERLWTRSTGAEELARQGTRELQNQVQALERQLRLAGSAAEEAQRRLTAKQRRGDRQHEDLEWRLAKVEQELAGGRPLEASQSLEEEGPLQSILGELEGLGARLAVMEARPRGAACEGSALDVSDAPAGSAELASRLAALELRVYPQLQELCASVASLRVKVDGQLQRQTAVNERIEAAQATGLDEIRGDVAEQRHRQTRDVESLVSSLRHRVDLVLEGADGALAEQVEVLAGRLEASEVAVGSFRKETRDLRAAFRLAFGHGGLLVSGGTELPVAAVMGQLGAMADQLETLDVPGRTPRGNRPPALGGRSSRGAEKAERGARARRGSDDASEPDELREHGGVTVLPSPLRGGSGAMNARLLEERQGTGAREGVGSQAAKALRGSKQNELHGERNRFSGPSADGARDLPEQGDSLEVVSPGGTIWETAMGGARSEGSESDGLFGKDSGGDASD